MKKLIVQYVDVSGLSHDEAKERNEEYESVLRDVLHKLSPYAIEEGRFQILFYPNKNGKTALEIFDF